MAQSSSSLPLPLQDRVAIVTGSSRGIGRTIALHLASLGARVVVNYVNNASQAEDVAAQINSSSSSSSPRAITIQADVSDATQVKSLFDIAEQTFNSPVHILVNSAAITDSKRSTLAQISVVDFDRIFSVNARGTFLCCREAANRLKRGSGGRIILLSTMLVASLAPCYGAYTASKAAVEAMTKILAKELKGTGITVNCIAPGPVATDMLFATLNEQIIKKMSDECPMGRLGETKDVASIVDFLATDASEWINGQVILATGGLV